jgi:hypothetical protein
MSKSKLTEANVLAAIKSGLVETEAIALSIGFGGKSGKVSLATLDKIDNMMDKMEPIAQHVTIPQEAQPPIKLSGKLKDPSKNPFAFGLKKEIFDIVSKSQKTIDDHAAYGARITGRPASTVRAFIRSMSDKTSNFNRGRTTNIGSGELVQIAAI